jgi:hypothetical protein
MYVSCNGHSRVCTQVASKANHIHSYKVSGQKQFHTRMTSAVV